MALTLSSTGFAAEGMECCKDEATCCKKEGDKPGCCDKMKKDMPAGDHSGRDLPDAPKK